MASLHVVSEFLTDRHPYLPEAHAAIFSSDIIVDEVAVAFGRRGVEKLIDVLRSHETSDATKLSSLILLIGELSTQERKAEAVKIGGVDACTALLSSATPACRANAAVALSRMVLIMQGRSAVKAAGSVLGLTRLLSDKDVAVRTASTAALGSLTYFRDGWDVFVQTDKAVEQLVAALPAHPAAVSVAVNVTAFYTAGALAALNAGITAALVDLLHAHGHDNGIANQTVLTLRHLAMHEVGKSAAITEGVVAELVALFATTCDALRVNVTGALALLGIALEAKHQFVKCGDGAVAALTRLLSDPHADVRTNARAAIDTLSELPALREVFTTAGAFTAASAES